MLATPAAPDAGDVKTSAVFAVQASPLPDKLIKSLPVDGTAVAGVSVIDMVTPVAPRITELKTTAGIAFPNEPSTIAGKVPIELRPHIVSIVSEEVATAKTTFVFEFCVAVGFVTRLIENDIGAPAANIPLKSCAVSTCPLNVA